MKENSRKKEKAVKVICWSCKKELEVHKSDVQPINGAGNVHDYHFAGSVFICPICKREIVTTEEQEKELGFPARG